MRWGCCGDLERLETIEAAGYEFIESPVRVLCVDEPPPAADRYCDAIRSSSLTVEALNVFLPGTLPIIGPDVNNDSLRKHVDTIISRISGLGTEIIVLGSGGARMIPEGWDRSTARDQLLAFCNLAADIAGPAGITIVIEPLCSDACNYILTVSEAHALSDASERQEIGTLADLYHMHTNGDPLTELAGVRADLKHVHLPVPNIDGLIQHDTDFDHHGYLTALKKFDYTGRISVEDNGGRFGDFDNEAETVLSYLREMWESI